MSSSQVPTAAQSLVDECRFCGREAGVREEAKRIVFQSKYWSLASIYDRNVPGWLVIWKRAHSIGLDSMTPEESAELGLLLGDVPRAIKAVLPVDHVFMFFLGESNPHLHGIFLARPRNTPADRSGVRLLLNFEEFRDDEASMIAARKIGAILSEIDYYK